MVSETTVRFLESLEADDARTEAHVRNVTEMVRAIVNPEYARFDTVLIQGTYFVVGHTGPYAYRFAVPQDERMWVAEYRNDICDPPGYWDHYGDGPLTSKTQTEVANWIADVVAPEDDERSPQVARVITEKEAQA